VTGTVIYNPSDHSFTPRPGPIFANLVLADEINRAPAKVQSALLEAMEERQVTIGGEPHPLPSPFLVLATQNPIEHEGTYPLPEAQTDRFMLKALVTYPGRAEERQLLQQFGHTAPTPSVNQVATAAEITAAVKAVGRVHLDDKITEYILDLVLATRPGHNPQLSERQHDADLMPLSTWIAWGASPRAGLALAKGARANAFIAGRDYVIPEDVKLLAPAVLRHRLILTYEAVAEDVSPDAVIAHILRELRTP
jgi:MoxR-like ATPase